MPPLMWAPRSTSSRCRAIHARADLFEGRVAVLTPTKNTRAEDYDTLDNFWSALGSVVVQLPAEEHDRALAMVSHVPHLVASALAAIQTENYFRLAGSGLLWDAVADVALEPDRLVVLRQVLAIMAAEAARRIYVPDVRGVRVPIHFLVGKHGIGIDLLQGSNGLRHGRSVGAVKTGVMRLIVAIQHGRRSAHGPRRSALSSQSTVWRSGPGACQPEARLIMTRVSS